MKKFLEAAKHDDAIASGYVVPDANHNLHGGPAQDYVVEKILDF